MKKYSLFVLFILPVLVFGQTENDIKVAGGQKTLELQFSPFGDNPIDINGIRARWFSTDQKAFRLNAFLGMNSNSVITQQEDEDADIDQLKDVLTVTTINIRPGIEKHLAGTDRLSPYFGAEFDLALQFSSDKEEFDSGTEVNYRKVVNAQGFVRLGANLVAGFDYYVAKKLYLGTELGFGLSYAKGLGVKFKSDETGFDEPDPIKQGGTFNLGPNVNAQIRLGYAF